MDLIIMRRVVVIINSQNLTSKSLLSRATAVNLLLLCMRHWEILKLLMNEDGPC